MQNFSTPHGPAMALPSPSDSRPAGQRSGAGSDSVLPPLYEGAARRPAPNPVPTEHPGFAMGGDSHATQALTGAREVGKYLVTPLIKLSANGWFAGCVSIRSGSESATTDRVLRLTRLFRCAKEAAHYAHAEALRWIGVPHRPATA